METLEQYDLWHRDRAASEAGSSDLLNPWHRTVAKLLPELQGSVLEIGCGRGDFSIWLSERFPKAKITGVDFSGSAISTAKMRAAARKSTVAFRVDNAESLSFPDKSFDYVISCECMEHVLVPGRMAREINRVLRPGGQFIVTTENYFNAVILLWLKCWLTGRPFNSGSGVQPHENFFLFWRVKKILEKNGLTIQHMESNYFQWLLLPRTDPGKLASKDIDNPLLKRLCRPLGRHFTYQGTASTDV